MNEINSDKKNFINDVVAKGRPVTARCYRLTDGANAYMDYILRQVTNVCEKPSLRPILYTVIKEFLVNGLKANIKRVLFDIQRLNIFDKDDYFYGMQKFKKDLAPEKINQFLPLLRAHGLFAQFYLEYSKEEFYLEITNNVLMTSFEALKIQEKFKNLSNSESMGEFFSLQIDEDDDDEEEGAGLGFLLVMQMLRNLPFPGVVSVYKNESLTLVQIHIPLTESAQKSKHSIRTPGQYQKLI